MPNFGQMLQPRFKDGFADDGLSHRCRQQRTHRLLQVGREARIHLRLDVHTAVAAQRSAHAQGVVGFRHARAHFQQLRRQRFHMRRNAAGQFHVAVRRRRRNHQRPRLNLVRDDGVVRAVEIVAPEDTDDIRARALDARAHRVQEVRQIHNMRLLGGVVDDGRTVRLGCGKHHVNRRADRYAVKNNVRARQHVRFRLDAPAHLFYICAQHPEPLEVLVNRARPDFASAGLVYLRLTTPPQQRTQQVVACAQALRITVGDLPAFRRARVNGHEAVRLIIHLCAKAAKNIHQRMNIRNIRQILNGAGLVAQQRRGNDRHRRVFTAADVHRSLKRVTARDEHSFFHEHGIRRSAGSPPAAMFQNGAACAPRYIRKVSERGMSANEHSVDISL